MAKTYDVKYTLGVDDQTAEGLKDAYKNLTSPIERLQKQWSTLNKALGIGAGIYLAREAFQKLMAVGREYAEFLEQKDRELAFQNLAESVGTNTQKIVTGLKKASHETLTFGEISKAASKALFQGIKPDQIIKLMEIARAATKVTGRDLLETFDSITLAVAMQHERMLEHEGIIIDYDKHLKRLTGTHNKHSETISESQKAQAFYNATLEAGMQKAQAVGTEIDSLNDRYKRAKATLADSAKDIKNAFLELTSPVYVKAFETLAGLPEAIIQRYAPPDFLMKYFDKTSEMLDKLQDITHKAPLGTSLSELQFNFPPDYVNIPEKIAEDSGKYTDEYWLKWEEGMQKAVDNYGKAILLELDKTHPLPKYVDDPENMSRLIDNQFKAIEQGWRNEEEKFKNSVGYRLGQSFGEGFSYGAERTISDGMFNLITGEFSTKSMLNNVLRMGARMLSDSFAEAFFETLGVKFSLTKFFTGLFTSIGGAAAGGAAGGSGGGGSITGGTGPVSYTALPTQKIGTSSPTVNNFNYYITDDPTLEKRINEAVRKSMRGNNLRQDIKGIN